MAPSHLHIVCLNLRNHGVLPPPGHADGEQVIDGGGIPQAGLASFRLVWKTTDDRLATRLDRHAATRRSGKVTDVSVFHGDERERVSHHGFRDEQQQDSFLHHVLRTEATDQGTRKQEIAPTRAM